jgi:hypothetical protein
MKLNPSRKDILALIFIRTIVELEITYDNGMVIDWGRMSTTMKIIYNRIVDIEKFLFKSKEMRPLYIECLEIAKVVWPRVKADNDDYAIHLEPVMCGLYFDRERELKKLGLHSKQFSDLYDSYYTTSDCDLEVQSRELVDEIYKMSDKVIFEKAKENKRLKNANQSTAVEA